MSSFVPVFVLAFNGVLCLAVNGSFGLFIDFSLLTSKGGGNGPLMSMGNNLLIASFMGENLFAICSLL